MMEPDYEARCPNCGEVKSKTADRWAVVETANDEGDKRIEVWCQECCTKAKAEAQAAKVN